MFNNTSTIYKNNSNVDTNNNNANLNTHNEHGHPILEKISTVFEANRVFSKRRSSKYKRKTLKGHKVKSIYLFNFLFANCKQKAIHFSLG
jgi:hypothetical protein